MYKSEDLFRAASDLKFSNGACLNMGLSSSCKIRSTGSRLLFASCETKRNANMENACSCMRKFTLNSAETCFHVSDRILMMRSFDFAISSLVSSSAFAAAAAAAAAAVRLSISTCALALRCFSFFSLFELTLSMCPVIIDLRAASADFFLAILSAL
jgi:hypothetical protein